jgi:hypothetical protein
VKALVKVAETKRWEFVKVMTSKDVPPAGIEAGENVFDTVGRLGVTKSISLTVQVPDVQPGELLVLVTDGGGVMDAVLVTLV